MKKKAKKWIRLRHIIAIGIVRFPIWLYSKLVYRIKIDKFKAEGNRQYLILFNHQTAFDQFFVSLSFKKHIYYVSSEDLFSNGLLSKLITWLVAPIPFRKSTSDIAAIKNCLRIAKEGGNIGMAPEGNRTYSGTTEYIKPGVASLAKTLKLPIALYRIEGGYGAHPRWSDKIRRGKMHSFVSRVIEPQEYENMSREELFEVIKKELYVDERCHKQSFYTKNQAEFLDRAMYYCLYCGLSHFYSKGNFITCTKCGKSIEYLPDKTLKGSNFDFPYTYVKDWYDAQCEFIKRVDLSDYENQPIFSDKVSFKENFYCAKKKKIDDNATLSVFKNKIIAVTKEKVFEFDFCDITAMTVLGRNKLNIYHNNQIFQCKGDRHFNALKYVNIYYKTVESQEEAVYGKFLGL